jgi:hypothetical protein
MRKLITIVEARAPKPVQQKSAAEVFELLKTTASKLTGSEIDIQFLSTWSDNLRAKIIEEKRKEEENYAHDLKFDPDLRPTAFDVNVVAMEELPDIFKYGSANSFSNVSRAIDQEILDYQKAQGARLDDEAGFASDFHFIESSDWLEAMELQRHAANKIKFSRVGSLNDIAAIAETLNDFCDGWKDLYRTEQGWEATLVEEMTLGLQNVIPLLMFAVKTALKA